jgi:protein disulfide-isomerase-like protein
LSTSTTAKLTNTTAAVAVNHHTGHCKALAPKYEKLAAAYAGESSVVIASVDAEVESALAQRYSVSGYPTLKLFGTGSAEPEAYNGKREVEDLVRNCKLHNCIVTVQLVTVNGIVANASGACLVRT